ncbi:LRRTM2 [Branchiostoma lanceolatum]|uniref:LRRTM2 protein n=1 Tax=Branchiostoma lanceolatum TaxID=7740 RepID=A0A8J9ZWY1_BRALA|nr:LRRTM2 [Branchiostoma lanceolatum]
MYGRGCSKENATLLFFLLLAAACAASNDPRLPQCKSAGWRECLPVKDKPGRLTTVTSGMRLSCVVCEGLDKGVASESPFPLVTRAENVAIRGYPFHVLSAKSLTPLYPSVVDTLALIDAKITDVENNTFAGFSSLYQLSLDSNRLTHVKQTWFTGLKKLGMLILSNNHIKQIDPGSFMHLASLMSLDLENNLLQVVEPSWLFGLKLIKLMNLALNEINSISPESFKYLQLTWLDLSGNDLACLDGEVLSGQTFLSRLHVGSGMLSSVHDAEPHRMMWSLHRLASMTKGSPTMAIEVPRFLFCARYRGVTPGLSFGWMFDSSDNVPRNIELGGVNPGRSCGALERSLSTISIHDPAVVLATDESLADNMVPNTLEQCRKVWEYNNGITMTVGLVGTPTIQLVSLAAGNTTFAGVAMSFVKAKDTSTHTTTESGCSQHHPTHTNATHDNTKNITCILLTKHEHMEMFFVAPEVQCHTHTTATTHKTNTDHSSSLTHYNESKYHTSSEPRDASTLQMITTPVPPPATDHVLISVVVSAVGSLVVLFLVLLVWKVCAARVNTEDGRASDDAHIWTIPPGVAFPGLLRSASLPACSGKMASDDVASCRSLPAVLQSIEPTYSEIPDDVAAAHRPLPGLPHAYSGIPDDAISGVVRSASLPAVTFRRGDTTDDASSCRSLPAVLQYIEPTYSEIPDHIADAQRPLPALPRTCWEISDHEAAAQRPLPATPHTYSEIPDEESGPMPFYADPAELSHHVVTNRRQNRRAFRDNTTSSSRHRSGRSIAVYGLAEQTKDQHNNFYRKAPEVHGIRSRRQLRTALVSQPADQGVRTNVNITDAILSRRASLPLVTLPNTYWPWEIPGEETRNTPRHAPLPLTLPNTYWPWEIPGEGSSNTPQRAPLPLTLPNTYWPWEIPGEGTGNTPRRAPLPLTLPNTYWPWEIPGEGTGNTPRRAPLPLTLPNTYWPWEIPGEGTGNTPRRAPLPLTLPNTYWPWEIPGEGTDNTPRRAPLPLTLPNTYWPWEIPGEGTGNTPRRASLPLTLPNTYWPWEISGEATSNTPQRAPLPLTLPNTYWPWKIPGEGTGNTPRRASLPLTLPNTYWPWEIPGEGTSNTPRRAPLPLALPNTYWPWEIPGEGTGNTPRRASLPLTLPNTYWPWEIPGERIHNTP